MKSILSRILATRDIEIFKYSNIAFVEKGFLIPDDKLVISFDENTINKLIEFIESITKETIVKKYIIGKTNYGYEVLPYEKIMYFETEGNYTYCNTIDNKKYKIREKLYEIENKLNNGEFARIAKSNIVNIIHIIEIIPWFNGKLLLKLTNKNIELEVSRNYVKGIKTLFGI